MKGKPSSKKIKHFKAKGQQVSRLNTGAETEEHWKLKKKRIKNLKTSCSHERQTTEL